LKLVIEQQAAVGTEISLRVPAERNTGSDRREDADQETSVTSVMKNFFFGSGPAALGLISVQSVAETRLASKTASGNSIS